MRQGAEQSAPTSFPCTTTCMIMLIIVNRIQFSYYSSFRQQIEITTSVFSAFGCLMPVLPVTTSLLPVALNTVRPRKGG